MRDWGDGEREYSEAEVRRAHRRGVGEGAAGFLAGLVGIGMVALWLAWALAAAKAIYGD